MSDQAQPSDAGRLECPACKRFLGVVNGSYNEFPPCICGAETIVRFRNRRGRQVLDLVGGERLEVKAR